MPTRPVQVLRVLITLGVLILGLVPLNTLAQAPASVRFLESTAVANFPQTIEFRLVSTVDEPIESVELFWRESSSSTLTLAHPIVTRGATLDAAYTADMTVSYLPPGIDVEYFWRITTESGENWDSPTETLFYMDGRFDWQSLEAGLVTVWWYQGSDEYAQAIVQSANRTLVRLADEFGLQTTDPIRLVIYGNDRDFSGALRPNSAEWIGGLAYSSLSHIVAKIRPDSNADREIQRMIPHEISHVVVHHASVNPYNTPPPWVDEGLATYIQGSSDNRLPPILNDAVRGGRLIPIGALKSSFPADPDLALLSYAESLSVVTYLTETYGSLAVGELVSIYKEEVSHDQAVQETLGMTLDELDTAWKTWLGYEGDQPVTRDGSSSGVGVRGAFWFGTIALLTLVIVGGMIAALFWRTREYARVDAEEADVEVLFNSTQDDPQP